MNTALVVRLSVALALVSSCGRDTSTTSVSAHGSGEAVVAPRKVTPVEADGDGDMTQVLARIPADVPVMLAASVGSLRRERATAPLIERLLHVMEIAAARDSWPACARALGDRAEWIVIGFPDVSTLAPSFVILSGPWSRTEAAACARDDARIKIVGERTIQVHPSSRGAGKVPLAGLPLDMLPAGTTLRIRVSMVLDRVSAHAELTAPDEESAEILERRLRAQLGGAQVPGSSVVLDRTGSRVRLAVDAGPMMLRVIESALP